MQFRLIYRGPLKAEGSSAASRASEKHAIRCALRPQLAELWRTHRYLKGYLQPAVTGHNLEATGATIEDFNRSFLQFDDRSRADRISEQFENNGYKFLPLIGKGFGDIETACSLDILFLRRDDPGSIVGGGDIDNRIKTLFDALKMPQRGGFSPAAPPKVDENPFYCLVQDDSLINEISVVTDRLLEPLTDGERVNDVHLIIHVRTLLISGSYADTVGSAAFAT